MNLKEWISYTLANFGLVMFVLALIIALIDWPIERLLKRATGAEVFFRWVILLALGITSIYACIMHSVFPKIAAESIGWEPSPFQFEVAMANFAIGVIAIAAFRAGYGFRLATVFAALILWWGAAVGHIYQMIVHHNFSVGNAGSWLWMDILVPVVLLIFLKKLASNNQN